MERASLRQTVTDRVIAVVLVVVAASGLMSVLPGRTQVAVSRLACRAASLGLGSCGTAQLDLQNSRLNPPRCPALATLDSSVPEVRESHLTTRDGLPVTISSARSGDVFVALGPDPVSSPPFLLDGEARGRTEVVPGVVLPRSTEWFLPSGQGLDALVGAVHDGHQQWVQRRSSLAVLGAVLARADRQVPPPTVLLSRVRLDQMVLPTYRTAPRVPLSGAQAPKVAVPSAPMGAVSVVVGTPAVSVFNRVTQEVSVVASLVGELNATAVSGTVRWTRDASGNVTSVVVAVVSTATLVPGEPAATRPSTGVAYIAVPVRTAPERVLAQQWLSDPDGFTVPLRELLGLRRADPDDQLGSFLTRAATVTAIRYAGITPELARRRTQDELTRLRRVEWTDATTVAVSTVSPVPDGSVRRTVPDPGCVSR